jgi:hypothetical protein
MREVGADYYKHRQQRRYAKTRARSGERAQKNGYRNGTKFNGLLSQLVYGMLPSPVASDATTGAIIGKNDTFRETSGLPRKVNQNGHDGSVGLARLVQLLPTPVATSYKGARSSEALEASGRTATNSLCDYFNQPGKSSQLNPPFVEEMMGYPIGWTELKH